MNIVIAAEKSSIATLLSEFVKRHVNPEEIKVSENPDETATFSSACSANDTCCRRTARSLPTGCGCFAEERQRLHCAAQPPKRSVGVHGYGVAGAIHRGHIAAGFIQRRAEGQSEAHCRKNGGHAERRATAADAAVSLLDRELLEGL